jgi:hypothetical protein
LRRWIALAAVLCVGCVSEPVAPAVLDDGKSLWQHVETEHFVVESNLSNESKVLRIAGEFETLWHAFASVPILGMRPPHEKPFVVLLRDMREYRYLAGGKSAGLFIDDTVLGPLILLPPSSSAFSETTVKHELAHLIASGSLANSPQWLQEGLAQVMETATYDAHDGRILLGDHSAVLVYRASFSLPASRFTEAWPAGLSSHELDVYYGRSWLLVHYLVDFDLKGFLDFFVRIRNGEDWRSAWDHEIFLPREGIDEALTRYYDRAKYGIWQVAARLPKLDALEAGSVSPTDALALRAALYAYSVSPARARAEILEAADRDLRAASALDPTSARVRTISAALDAARK